MAVFARVLVTGGAGFIGAHFVEHLLGEACACVVVLDAFTYAAAPIPPQVAGDPRFALITGDINDTQLVTTLLAKYEIDAVVHLAAESHVDRSIDAPAAFVQTNTVGTFKLLEAVVQHRALTQRGVRFVHISTDEVFGSVPAPGRSDEDAPVRPNSPYSASKAAADSFVRAYHSTYGVDAVTVRLSNVYGPRQFPEKLIPLMALRARRGESLPVYGDGGQVRDWLHVHDACAAIYRVLAAGVSGEAYNVAGGALHANLEVVRFIRDLVGQGTITHVADRPGHDRRYAMAADKIAQQLGWSPQRSFESGLAATLRWYADNAVWVATILSGDYQLERLGLSRTK